MWDKVLKLEQILPKQLISRNRKQITELSFAIVLTKLGDLQKAEVYTKRAVLALERELKINKSIKIEDNICPSNDPKDRARFTIRMQSLCLAYHHLGTIKRSLGNNKKALELFTLARAISQKYIKDGKLKKIIHEDREKMLPKASPLFSKRSSVDFEKPKLRPLDDKTLLEDIFGKNKGKSIKDFRRTESVASLMSIKDNLTSIAQNMHESSFQKKKKSTFKREILEEPGNKLRLANEISYLRRVENKAAMCIQRFYRGYKVRNRTKNLIKGYIEKMLPDSSRSSHRLKEPNPLITIFSFEDEIGSKVEEKSQGLRSGSIYTDEKNELGCQSDSSDPDIIVKLKSGERRQRKSKPSLFDYLNLHSPDLFISQSINGRIFNWKVSIVRKKILDGNIECVFGIFGNYEKFTDTLVYLQTLLIDTNQIDQRFLCPFPFETIWPVIEAELTKDDEENDEEGEFEAVDDETSFTTIKDLANFILSRSGVENKLTGTRLVERLIGFTMSERPSDFHHSKHILVKDGVFKSMSQYAQHERQYVVGNKSYFKQLENGLIGKVIEKGMVYLKHTFFLLQLKVVPKQGKTKFLTSIEFYLSAMNSNWFDQIILTWEDFKKYFESEKLFIDIYYIICTQKIQATARELLYNTFSNNFHIHNSQLTLSRDKKNDDAFDTQIFICDYSEPQECHEEWEANLDQFVSIYDNEADNLCLGIFPAVSLYGEVDQMHLKFTGINKNILIEGKRCKDDAKFLLLVSDYTQVKRISKIFETSEIVKSILQYEISVKKGLNGKTLTFERYKKCLNHSSIRKIEGSQYLITISVSTCFRISLYNLSTSWQLITTFSNEDLIQYFPQLGTENSSAIYYEESFVQPLLSGFSLFRGIFGTFSAWEIPKSQETAQNQSKKIQAFQFTEKKNSLLQEIITTKSLFERKISMVLHSSESFLTETVHQEQVLLQRSRIVCGLYCLVTVTKLMAMEEWRVYLHIYQSSREYVCKIYNSDMFGLRSSAFDRVYEDPSHTVNKASSLNRLWEIILTECSFEHHNSLDFIFKFDTIVTPMRELLYSNHIQNYGFYYFELYMKCSIPFHLKFSTLTSIKETEYIIFTIRSYNLQRKLWEKSSMRLKEVILELLNAGIVNEGILLNTLISYSDLKFFAGALCRILKMKNKENTVQVKLLPDLQFSESDEEDYFEEKNSSVHSVSSILEQDALLYQEIYKDDYPIVIGVHYNQISDEFAFKAYKPTIGAIFRVPMSKSQIFRKISFSQTLLREKAYLPLGKKIFSELLERLLAVVKFS